MQQITFAKDEERFKNVFNISDNNCGCIIGSFLPLNVPFINDCNIKIDFDNAKRQWYIVLNKSKKNEINLGSPYETYVWIFNHEELPLMNNQLPSNIESSPVELKENMIINTGGCYLKIRSN